jgi:hypothetical protein
MHEAAKSGASSAVTGLDPDFGDDSDRFLDATHRR